MAKNVKIRDVTYESVPNVEIPLADGSGTAKFVDTGSGDAVASDIRAGKKAWADGSEVTGSVPEKGVDDVSVNGKNVIIPAGIYDDPVTKSIGDGTVTPGATVAGTVLGDTVTDYEVSVTPSAAVSAGYVSGDKSGAEIKKYVQVEEKQATPSTAVQDVTPSSGKLLKKVRVAAVDVSATATEDNVPTGITFFSNSLTRKTGRAKFPSITQDELTKVLTIQ